MSDDSTGTSGPRASAPPLSRLYLINAALTLGYGSVFTLLGELRDRFGFSETELGLISSFGFVGGLISQVGLSRYADRGHVALMVRCGLLAAMVSMAAMSVADQSWQFVGSRFAFGLGTGAVAPALRRLVIDRDPGRVGENLGRMTSFDVAGFVLGPAVAAVLVIAGGIRAPFVALLVLYAVLVPVVATMDLRTGQAVSRRRVVRRLLAQRPFMASMAVAVAFYTTIGVFEAIWAVMLTDLGAGPLFVGVTLSLFTVPMVFLAPRGGRTAQRRGPLVVARGGVIAAIVCMLGYGITAEMADAPESGAHVVALAVLLVLSMAHAVADSFTMPANQVAVAMASPEGEVASGQGLFGATGLAVAAVAALGAGGLYDLAGPLAVMVASAGAMLVALAIGLRLGRASLAPSPAG